MRSHQILMSILACGILLACTAPAAAFHVSYNYYVFATNSDENFEGSATLLGQTHAEGTFTSTGEFGNYGTVAFEVDLTTGTLSATAHSHGLAPYPQPGGTARVEHLEFREEIYYTVPAGYYETGVQVGLTARAFGTLTADVGAAAEIICYIETGYVVHNSGLTTLGVSETGTIQVDDDIVLSYNLVWPGTTLLETTVYSERITAYIHRGRAWSPAYNPGGGYVNGDGDLDFADGFQVLSIDVPPGVTWTSGSGVFLGAVSAVGNGAAVAAAPRLYQNHPNPFNPSTTIAFDLPAPGPVDLHVYDVAGHLVKTLLAGETLSQGRREAVWRGRDEAGAPVATGIYYYRLQTHGHVETKPMILLK